MVCNVENVLNNKSKEYSSNKTGMFHNFNIAAKRTYEEATKVLLGFMLKHLVSIEDLVLKKVEFLSLLTYLVLLNNLQSLVYTLEHHNYHGL